MVHPSTANLNCLAEMLRKAKTIYSECRSIVGPMYDRQTRCEGFVAENHMGQTECLLWASGSWVKGFDRKASLAAYVRAGMVRPLVDL